LVTLGRLAIEDAVATGTRGHFQAGRAATNNPLGSARVHQQTNATCGLDCSSQIKLGCRIFSNKTTRSYIGRVRGSADEIARPPIGGECVTVEITVIGTGRTSRQSYRHERGDQNGSQATTIHSAEHGTRANPSDSHADRSLNHHLSIMFAFGMSVGDKRSVIRHP
jgi:hypothetical protein